MYLCKLIIRNIFKMYKESKSIFIYIILGIITSVYGIMFYSGYLMTDFFSQTNNYELTVNLNMYNKETVYDIASEIMNSKSLEYISLSSDSVDSNGIKITGMYDVSFSQHILYGNFYNINDTEPQVIISDYTAKMLGYTGVLMGKKIDINNEIFEIIGIHSFTDDICFPPYYYIENNKVTKLKANFNNKLSEKTLSFLDNNKINYELKNNSNIFSSPVFLLNFIIVMMIFSISFLNIIALFSFWKIRMKNTFMAYHICGCGNKEKIMIISGTLILIILISSFIALGLFLISFPKLVNFKIISDLPSVNYIYIFLSVVIILSLYSVLFGIHSTKTKSKRNFKENV